MNLNLEDMKINLTQIGLVFIILVVSLWGVRQCSDSSMYEKAYEEAIKRNVDLSTELRGEKVKVSLKNTEVEKMKGRLDSIKQSREVIIASYEREIAKVKEYTSDSIYALIKGSHELSGTLYDIDSSLLTTSLITRIELEECKLTSESYKTEAEQWKEAMRKCAVDVGALVGELDQCVEDREKLGSEVKQLELKGKELKKKIWVNRGVAGGVGLLALLILL